MKSSKSHWPTEEWKRKQGRESRRQLQKSLERDRLKRLEPRAMPQITKPGLYWFIDLDHRFWLAQVVDSIKGKSKLFRWGTLESKEVDSIGVGEFIGPLTPLSGY